MIKFAVAAIWICAATIGSIYVAISMNQPKSETAEAKPAYFGGLDYVKTEVLSVPVLQDGGINGYFLTRLVYTVEQNKLAKLTVPAETLIVDAVYTYLYSNPQIDFTRHSHLDLDALRNGIRDAVNGHVEDQLIHEVMIEQIDFLTKDEIRDNTMRRKQAAVDADRVRQARKAGTDAVQTSGH
ncbi:MAG: hypothetical protein K5872_12270 [Rhizobiaceae bacterium]|nr:hypothetical protein [Rhizobiaceae bacterium]MCV0406992.1 hypothetical protein [Rhizobiaceae bacterium]